MSVKHSILLKLDDAPNLKELLKFAELCGYCGLMTTVVNSHYVREFVNEDFAVQQTWFTRSPMVLSASEWLNKIVPCIEPRNLAVKSEEILRNNELQFKQEVDFAVHLNNYNVCIKLTNQSDPEAVGKYLVSILPDNFDKKIYVEIPMIECLKMGATYDGEITEDEEVGEDQWTIYHKFHKATGYDPRMQVALELTPDLPSDEELKRWLGEKIGMLIIPHRCFVSNNSFYPVIKGKHKDVVAMFLQYTKCLVAIQPTSVNDSRIKNYLEYVDQLAKSSITQTEHSGYEDTILPPLQPLRDNLDTGIYEVFERDPVKYRLYQDAIEAALIDKIPEAEKETKKLILMVVGAGRGPLIRAAINAKKNTGRLLKIIVVEKNQNAVVTLSSMIQVLWQDEDITLFAKDMRKLHLTDKVDIVVSELLGSFGDNELSPECLDGIQKFLKPDGISIPCDSISYVRPLMTTKVYDVILDHPIRSGRKRTKLYSLPTEVNWQVYLSSVYYIDEPKELFTFVHPNHDEPIDNTRYRKLTFTAAADCVLHGFSGYFTSKLYKDIELSILPATHTQQMVSWFSTLFPTQQPIEVKKGETITVEFWRKVDTEKVWYEWKSQDGDISNKGGEIHPIMLTSK